MPELEPVTVSARSVRATELDADAGEGRRSDDVPEQLTMRRLRAAD